MLLTGVARAEPATTRDALDRLQEILQLRLEDGTLTKAQVMPALLVSAEPRFVESEDWYGVRAIEVLQSAFGTGGLRLCEACMAPRAHIATGSMVWQAGPVEIDEIVRLDDGLRGDAQPAKVAIWLDEHDTGVAIRIVDLSTGRLVFAQNVDPDLLEDKNSQRMFALSAELERRHRGKAVTQAFVDFTMYPGQHLSLDWTDQWGPTNRNLSGLTISLYDPVIGVGACHYRAIEAANILVGGKLILSMPTAIVASLTDDPVDIIDPPLTLVGVVRVPFGRSNYGAIVSASTNGEVGIGISLMNISLLPVIP